MTQRLIFSIFATLALAIQLRAADPIVFEEAIAPILRQNCVACHHAKKAEGGLNLESFATLARGGDSGTVFETKQVETSILLNRITADPDSIMPPPDNKVDAKPLTDDQIKLVKRWIEEGALSKATSSSSIANLQRLPDHVQVSYAMTVTPDGRWLVFARGNDLFFCRVPDWEKLSPASIQPIVVKDAHLDSCFAMAVSPDGQRVATGSLSEVKLWRRRGATRVAIDAKPSSPPKITTPSGDSQKRLTYDNAAIVKLIPSPDNSLLVTLDDRQHMRLWNALDGTLVGDQLSDSMIANLIQQRERDVERQQHRLDRWNAKLSELNKVVDQETKAIEVATKAHETAKSEWEAKKQELQKLLDVVTPLENSVKQMQVAIEAGKMQATDLAERKKQANAEVEKLDSAISGFQTLIELANQKLSELTKELEPNKKAFTESQTQEAAAKTKLETAELALKQSQESLRLATTAVEGQAKKLEPEPKLLDSFKTELEQLKKSATDVRISSLAMAITGGNDRIVSINEFNQLEVYLTSPFQRESLSIPLKGAYNSIRPIDEHEIEVSGPDQLSQRWHVETTWELELTIGPELPGVISDRVNALAFNHDGSRLAIGSGVGSRNGHLSLVEFDASKVEDLTIDKIRIELSEPDFHSDTIMGLAFSPDGRWLASCGADKLTKIMRLDNFQNERILEGHTHHVLGVAWQNDAQYISTTSGDGTIKVWNIESGETLRTLNVGKELTGLRFVGGTTKFASAVIDHSVRLHDINSNDQIRQFNAAKNALYTVDVSPDGRFVIASGLEGIPRVWQIEDGKLVAELGP